MKGSSYPKRRCQESSKTFHNTLGRKFTYVLTIELSRRGGCSASTQKIFFHTDFLLQWAALRTRLSKGGHSPIRASSSSPARIGPTPEGVPVKMTSPGKSVKFWLAKETRSATE